MGPSVYSGEAIWQQGQCTVLCNLPLLTFLYYSSLERTIIDGFSEDGQSDIGQNPGCSHLTGRFHGL